MITYGKATKTHLTMEPAFWGRLSAHLSSPRGSAPKGPVMVRSWQARLPKRTRRSTLGCSRIFASSHVSITCFDKSLRVWCKKRRRCTTARLRACSKRSCLAAWRRATGMQRSRADYRADMEPWACATPSALAMQPTGRAGLASCRFSTSASRLLQPAFTRILAGMRQPICLTSSPNRTPPGTLLPSRPAPYHPGTRSEKV